jgi:hypothetical protein
LQFLGFRFGLVFRGFLSPWKDGEDGSRPTKSSQKMRIAFGSANFPWQIIDLLVIRDYMWGGDFWVSNKPYFAADCRDGKVRKNFRIFWIVLLAIAETAC